MNLWKDRRVDSLHRVVLRPGKRSVCWAGRRTKCWRRKPCPRRMLCCCAPKTIRARSAVRAAAHRTLFPWAAGAGLSGACLAAANAASKA